MADYVPNQDDAKIVWLANPRDNIDEYRLLTTACVPEVREYQAFGVLSDVQIGQPSDTASVTFGG